MRKILFILLFSALGFAQTPPIDGTGRMHLRVSGSGNNWTLTLTQNVPILTFDNPFPGAILTVTFVQDNVGGHTVGFDSFIFNTCNISTSANASTICQYFYDPGVNQWWTFTIGPTGTGMGTVGSFGAGNFAPLFTTSVSNPTTNPGLSFIASNFAANTVFANVTTNPAPPSAVALQGTDIKILSSGTVSGTGSILCTDASGGATTVGCPAGSGTTTSFSSGNLAPLFTTSVANPTTTPALSFSLTNAGANSIFGNFTGSSGAPSYNTISACGDSTHALAWTSGTGFTCQSIPGSGTGISGLTAGQVAIAGSATTITSSKPLQGTDTNVLSAGTVSGTGSALCTDANGGATTSGCPSGSPAITAYYPNDAAGTTNGLIAEWTGTGYPQTTIKTMTFADANTGRSAPLVGVVVTGGGTSGNALVQFGGTVQCKFDNTNGSQITQGATVYASSTNNGYCQTRASNQIQPNENPEANIVIGSVNTTVASITQFNAYAVDIINPTKFTAANTASPLGAFVLGQTAGSPFSTMLPFYGDTQSPATSQAPYLAGPGFRIATGANQNFVDLFAYGLFGYNSRDVGIDGITHCFGYPSCGEWRQYVSTYTVPNVGQVGCSNASTTCNASGTVNFGAAGGHWFVAGTTGTYSLILTGNVTFNNPVTDGTDNPGHILTFEICQDGTGGRTLTWPTTFKFAPAIPAAANACTDVQFFFDGTNYREIGHAAPISILLTSQSASIGSTAITTPQTEGFYKVNATLDCRSTVNTATVSGTISWTDPSNTAQSLSIPTATCTTLGSSSFSTATSTFRIKAGTSINYTTTAANTPSYDLSIALDTLSGAN